MRIIVSEKFPPKGFKAITLWPFIFAHETPVGADLRHELIHGKQQMEILYLAVALTFGLSFVIGWWALFVLPLYYIIYGLMWLVELFRCLFDKSRGTRADGRHRPTWKRAYIMIPYEREAYYGEKENDYLKKRKPWNWIHFIK
jgi:hypothetical protein